MKFPYVVFGDKLLPIVPVKLRGNDYLFAPTEKAKAILLGEGIPEERIFVTGNTIVDAIYQNLESAKRGLNIKPISLNSELSTRNSALGTTSW